MREAFSYMCPSSEDLLRFGIIEFENGLYDSCWNHVSEALLLDSEIEKRKHAYESYIHRIIEKQFGKDIDIDEFIAKLRLSNKSLDFSSY